MAEPNTSHLSIGEVLGLLLEEFPDITISKIRFLESQGLIEPERTPSGYRKFYEHDVELLRVILREQREHFLPLRVIKDRLDAGVIEPSTPPHGSPAPGRADATPTAAAIANHPAAGRNGSAAPAVPSTATPSPTERSVPTIPPRRLRRSRWRQTMTRRACSPESWSIVRSCARWRRSQPPSSPRSRSTA